MRHVTRRRNLLVVLVLLALAGLAVPAQASPYVYRPITLSRSEWALDVGLGIGHLRTPDATGLGLNLEVAAGITSFVQLGIRTGLRFGRDGRATRADSYGRTFETETYGVGSDDVANPELAIKWALLHGAAEIALDTRLYLPVEDGTRVGIMIGLPIALHIGGTARLDTGIFVPILFYDETVTVISFPLHLWIQASNQVVIGAITGIRIVNGAGSHTEVPLGVALGFAVAYNMDLRTWLLFPDVRGNGSARNFGLGFGLEARF
jgi:hypothetical protein